MQKHWSWASVSGFQAWWSCFTICAGEFKLCLENEVNSILQFLLFLSAFLQSVGNLAIPICLMGLLSVFAGFCSLKLPETKDSPTPDTLEELRAK